MSSGGGCTGYRWSQGQYVLSDCTQESSTFFIILGFTMLVLVLLVFIIIVIACIRRQRNRARAQHGPRLSSQGGEDDCVISVDGSGQQGALPNGGTMDSVKAVIMAGEENPTFIAHPVKAIPPDEQPPVGPEQSTPGESSKQGEPDHGVT